MTERERGTAWDAESANRKVRSGGMSIGEASPASSISTAERDEETERRRFMAALERVMSDHRNVLAALAK